MLDLLFSQRPADILPNILQRHTLHLLGGYSRSGKSRLLGWILGKLSRGEEVFELVPDPPKGGIYYLSTDRPAWQYKETFDAVGLRIGTEIAGFYSIPDRKDYKPWIWNNTISLWDEAVKGLNPKEDSILVVDVLGHLIPKITDQKACLAYVTYFTKWASEHKCTVIGVVHGMKIGTDPKTRPAKLFDRVIGSNGLASGASTVMYLTSPEETGVEKRFQELEISSRNAAQRLYHCSWKEEEGRVMLTPDGPAVQEIDKLQSTEGVEEWLILSLIPTNPDEAVRTSELVRQAIEVLNMKERTVYRKLKVLEEKGIIRKTARSGGWFAPTGNRDFS